MHPCAEAFFLPSLHRDSRGVSTIAVKLTAIVPPSHRRDEKKYIATVRLVTDALREQKPSRL